MTDATMAFPQREHGDDFWVSSGYFLLERADHGGLLLTDAFLKAYLARPELMPPPEACTCETALHKKLLADPRAAVSPEEIAAIADTDARENWRVLLAFRNKLMTAPTLEAAYSRMIREGVSGVPPLFLAQLVHVIMRAALEGCSDAFTVRAAEMFFRAQRATAEDGRLLLADMETVDMRRHDLHASPLLAMFAGETGNLDILKASNAGDYWARSDAFDMVFDLGGREGREALAKALSLWMRQLSGLTLVIEPLEQIEDADVRWIAGLDAEATRIGNALWQGDDIDPADALRLIAIFAIQPDAALPFLEQVAGKPVYLLLAMDEDKIVRMKPQNLLTSLPFDERARAH